MKFSDRIGVTEVKSQLQIDNMSVDLRNSLWSVFDNNYVSKIGSENTSLTKSSKFNSFIASLWFSYFKKPIDEIPYQTGKAFQSIRSYFFSSTWYDAYNFIEFVISN